MIAAFLVFGHCGLRGDHIAVAEGDGDPVVFAKTSSGVYETPSYSFVVVTAVSEGSSAIDDDERYVAAFLRYNRTMNPPEFLPAKSWIVVSGQAMTEIHCSPVSEGRSRSAIGGNHKRVNAELSYELVAPDRTKSVHGTLTLDSVATDPTTAAWLLAMIPQPTVVKCERAQEWRQELTK